MIEIGPSSVLNCSPPDFRPVFKPSRRRLIWPNGSIAILYSGDTPDQLRGQGHHKAWVDELAKFQYPTETWDQLELTMREGKNPQVFVSTTPRPIAIMRALNADPNTVVTRGSTKNNLAFLNARFVERVFNKYGGTKTGRQELEGELLDDLDGALWTRNLLNQTRTEDIEGDIVSVVVGVDPAVTNSEDSNETGIVVACKTDNGHFWVLADNSARMSVDGWARMAVLSGNTWAADRIVGESNQGGDLVEAVIKQALSDMLSSGEISNTCLIKTVRATRGKIKRAEPVSMLWEQGRGHFVGRMENLEDQLCTYSGDEEIPSDRLDAMVWAITELQGGGEFDLV